MNAPDPRPIGILAALLQLMGDGTRRVQIGQRDYYEGILMGRPCVLVLARVGKVAAAATTVTLIREFNVASVVFAGLAGALSPQVAIGDIVVADTLLQHDIDASPLFPRYEVPLLGRSLFAAEQALSDTLWHSADTYMRQEFEQDVAAATRQRFGLDRPAVHRGLIVSGDVFVNDPLRVAALRADLPNALCVEMEGAAVAQICHEYEVPCAVLRTISDRADGSASVDFSAFLREVASHYSAGILRRFLQAPQVQDAAPCAGGR